MLSGYVRVSTQDQNLDLQRRALQQAGCEKTKACLKCTVEVEVEQLTSYIEDAHEELRDRPNRDDLN